MKTYEIVSARKELPAGKYYIGDPCYVIDDDEWMDALHETRYFNLYPTFKSMKENDEYNPKHLQYGVFERDKGNDHHRFAVGSTAYGDGEYPCIDRGGALLGTCGVDAGLISAIPVSMIDMNKFNKNYGGRGLEALGVVHNFHRPFEFHYDGETLSFGEVEVHTGDNAEKYYE